MTTLPCPVCEEKMVKVYDTEGYVVDGQWHVGWYWVCPNTACRAEVPGGIEVMTEAQYREWRGDLDS